MIWRPSTVRPFRLVPRRRNKAIRVDKPWRTYMRLAKIMPISRGPARGAKDFLNLRNSLIANLVGRKTAGFKLRPSARVGLEWARLGRMTRGPNTGRKEFTNRRT